MDDPPNTAGGRVIDQNVNERNSLIVLLLGVLRLNFVQQLAIGARTQDARRFEIVTTMNQFGRGIHRVIDVALPSQVPAGERGSRQNRDNYDVTRAHE